MGVISERLYFRQGFPDIRDVKKKFHELTGLRLTFSTELSLNQLTHDEQEISYRMFHSGFGEQSSGNGNEFHKLGWQYFSCKGFDHLYIGENAPIEEKSFYLECSGATRSLYFFTALIKAMLELGGNVYRYNVSPPDPGHVVDDFLEPYHPHDREWKKVRKWEDMSAFERADFSIKFN